MSPNDITSDPFPPMNSNRPRDILPSILANSPPGRSSTLPPIQRSVGPNRPRKQSVTKRGREAHHKKQKSRGSANDWLRRIQNDDRLRPGGHDRKALSAEPSADYGKRWEDLIDAADQAASAAGDADGDRTPVSYQDSHQTKPPGFPNELTERLDPAITRFHAQGVLASIPARFPWRELPSVATPTGSDPAVAQSRRRCAIPVGREW